MGSFLFFFADFDEKNDDCVSAVITLDNDDQGDKSFTSIKDGK